MELLNKNLNEDEKSLYSSFLAWYEAYQKNDINGIIDCVDDNVLSVGTGDEEVSWGKKNLLDGYNKDFDEVREITITDPEVIITASGDDGLVLLRSFNKISFKGGSSSFYKTRRSISYKRKNGKWLQTHLHHSRPDPEQVPGRSFPMDSSVLSRYSLLFSASRDTILMIDSETGDIVEANQAASILYGCSIHDLVRKNARDIFYRESYDFFMSKISSCSESGDLFETRHVGPFGVFYCEVSISPAEIYNRKICVCVIRDITNRKKAEKELKASKDRLKMALESTRDGLWEVTFPDRDLYISDYFTSSLGFAPEDNLATFNYNYWIKCIYPSDIKRINRAFIKHVSGKEEVRVEFRIKKASGEWLWVMARGRVVNRNPDGTPARMFGTVMNIDARKKREQGYSIKAKKLEIIASVDSLTGIMNRHKFDQIARDLISRSNESGKPLSLIMFDLDFFKKINDSRGHQEGDKILSQVCRLIRSRLRFSDVFARWGGDEFMILISDEKKVAFKIAEDLRCLIERSFKKDVNDVTASFGVASYKFSMTLKAFSAAADAALYRAKRNGRNQVSS